MLQPTMISLFSSKFFHEQIGPCRDSNTLFPPPLSTVRFCKGKGKLITQKAELRVIWFCKNISPNPNAYKMDGNSTNDSIYSLVGRLPLRL